MFNLIPTINVCLPKTIYTDTKKQAMKDSPVLHKKIKRSAAFT